jgi:adenylate kinase family enzyme
MRIAITGGPQTGKTTLAVDMVADRKDRGIDPDAVLIHGDDFIELGWSQSSQALAHAMRTPGPWVAEGVQVPRALRKMLEARPDVKPIDRLIILGTPRKDQSEGQRRMSLGLDTVLAELLPRLRGLGVEIEKP